MRPSSRRPRVRDRCGQGIAPATPASQERCRRGRFGKKAVPRRCAGKRPGRASEPRAASAWARAASGRARGDRCQCRQLVAFLAGAAAATTSSPRPQAAAAQMALSAVFALSAVSPLSATLLPLLLLPPFVPLVLFVPCFALPR